MSQIAQYRGTGKRKTSVARVILRPGGGSTWFNGRTIEDYFPRAAHRTAALAPLKIAVTGNKLDDKLYYRHSGYPGGLRQRTLREQLDRLPTEVLRKAVRGMLPRNRLGRQQLTKLKIYAGPEHPHAAQEPKPF